MHVAASYKTFMPNYQRKKPVGKWSLVNAFVIAILKDSLKVNLNKKSRICIDMATEDNML